MATSMYDRVHPAPALVERNPVEVSVERARGAQALWAAVPISERLAVLKQARHLVAAHSCEIAASVPARQPSSLQRNLADTLIAEVLPLAESIRFLEREAKSILRPCKLGRSGRPFWLSGIQAEIHRAPFGVVLIIAPSNYPLFLPGVQCMQALAAGNAVLWKPAAGGANAARALARILAQAGLPDGLVQVLDDSPQAGIDAIRAGVDKVFVTGHENTGRAVMHELAEVTTPSVMELSGCDAVFVLPGADLERVACALAFGMRLNGSATCMAPRRVFASSQSMETLLQLLLPKLQTIAPTLLTASVRGLLDALLQDARRRGANIALEGRGQDVRVVTPTVVIDTPADAAILRTDIFAPLVAFCTADNENAALAANAYSPYSLTASVFGPEREARALGAKLAVGTVLINDLIVSTADPRVPFGGRGASGFGSTRGREGLLEMTMPRTILTQSKSSLRAYAATTDRHEPFFASYIEAAHSASFLARCRGLRRLFASARDLENES